MKEKTDSGVVTVLPVFPYSRQPDVPYVRPDTALANAPAMLFKDSVTVSSGPTATVNFFRANADKDSETKNDESARKVRQASGDEGLASSIRSMRSHASLTLANGIRDKKWEEIIGPPTRGNYRQWVAQAGTLVADLLTVAGTDHVITMDLHVF
jgi:ribose-phosphate pyrophosphokinase